MLRHAFAVNQRESNNELSIWLQDVFRSRGMSVQSLYKGLLRMQVLRNFMPHFSPPGLAKHKVHISKPELIK